MTYPDSIIGKLGRVVHEANRAYCVSIGDHVQADWDHIDPDMQQSVINGIRRILDNPNASPKESHDTWVDSKQAQGWKWGAVRDDEEKLHPSLVPYKQLPLSERYKDYLFRDIVKSYLKFIDTENP